MDRIVRLPSGYPQLRYRKRCFQRMILVVTGLQASLNGC